MQTYVTEAAMAAFRQLLAINVEAGSPRMDAWLRSEVAQPVLTEILLSVPCSATLH